MKYAILSDIHANLEAFHSVLNHLRGIDKIISPGDIVGYGPNPNECIKLANEKDVTSVVGNNDQACLGKIDLSWFNRDSRDAIMWTAKELFPESKKYLDELPDYLEIDDFEIVHGSLRDRTEEYITNLQTGILTIELMKKKICFVGHSHIPLCIVKKKDGEYDGWEFNDGDVVDVSKFNKLVINVGGVGQPRDGDPRASFGVYDSVEQKVQIHKVSYNIEETQRKMREAQLPSYLIERLKYGK